MRPAPVGIRLLLRRLAREEGGFTLVELLSAVLVVSIGVIALLVTFDTSRNLVSFSEAKETTVHWAEQELEELLAVEYDDLALDGVPACSPSPCTSANQLAYYVGPTIGPDTWFRWDQTPMASEASPAPRCTANGTTAAPITHCEALVLGGSVPSAVTPETTPTPSGDTRLQLEVQRFVTWADDDCGRSLDGSLAPGCVGDKDYKRVTVAVRVVRADSSGRLEKGPKEPVVLSAVVRE